MTSQTDLDQGGTSREWTNVYLGPSVGWVRMPARNILGITVAGTYNVDLSTNYVQINCAGTVIINLPAAAQPAIPAGATPGQFTRTSVAIVDIGGHAAANPITIQPVAGETIMGLASLTINSNYGGFILYPNAGLKVWTNQA